MRGVNSEQMIDEVFKAIEELIDLIHAFSKGRFPATDEEGRIRKFIDEHASGDLTESDKNAMRRITGDRRRFIQAFVKSEGDNNMDSD